MDKRSRIWIIVLALLLAAALALCVFFKLRLDDMIDEYDAVVAGRTKAEQTSAETETPTEQPTDEPTAEPTVELADEPDAADDPRDSEIETLNAELEAAREREDALRAENERLEAELAAYSETTAEPESTADAEAEALQADLAAARTEIEALTARAETAEAEIAAMTERAETAEAELAMANAELAAYRARSNVADGDRHFSAAADYVVYVSADGVSAEYAVCNNTASGNSIVFELSLDGEVIYTSEKLAPGRKIDGFKLAEALKPGSYAGAVSIKTLNANGDVISVISTAVTIEVAR